MKFIETDFDIPYYNFALEKYLLTESKFTDDYFFFYIHKPSVILGKHQNAYEEINLKFISDNNIYVARRLSGGGCVYHDEGNLNFSFVTHREANQNIDFAKYTKYIIQALDKYGIKAELQGRNDLCIDGKKFSGNSQYITENKVLHHGTLMFNVNTENMLNALNVRNIKIESKAIKSIKSRVTNIAEYAPDTLDITHLKESILHEIFHGENAEIYRLTDDDINKIKLSADSEFSRHDYNFGIKTPCNMRKERKYSAGIIRANINIKENMITHFELEGDFFENRDITALETALTGLHFEKEEVIETLKKINFDGFIKNFTTEEMIDLLFF